MLTNVAKVLPLRSEISEMDRLKQAESLLFDAYQAIEPMTNFEPAKLVLLNIVEAHDLVDTLIDCNRYK